MTIQNTTIRKAGPSQGNGVTTVFPFTFKVFTATDILVTYLNALAVESVLVLSTNYTVSLNADQNTSPGGSVTLLVAPVTATYITLTSQVTNTQTLALTNSGGFYPESINNALDRTVIEIQQLAEQASRSIAIPKSSTASPLLPSPAANNVLVWNNTATALINLPATAGTSLVDLAASTGSTLVGTTKGGTGSVTRTVASKLNDTVSVKDFGADPTGAVDSLGAFNAAIASLSSAGGTIDIPAGTWNLSAVPTTGTKSMVWNINSSADFIGAGTVGNGSFPRAVSNVSMEPTNVFIQSKTTKTSTAENAVGAVVIEMLQPVGVNGGALALYAATAGSNALTMSNLWAANFLVKAEGSANRGVWGVEIDVDSYSANAMYKGLEVTGIGSFDPQYGITIARADASRWQVGININNAETGINITGTGLGRGIAINSPLVINHSLFTARAIANGDTMMVLQRFTDTAPTGYFQSFVDTANTKQIFSVDVLGNVVGNSLTAKGAASATFAGAIAIGSAITLTATAGGASALPALPVSYLSFYAANVLYKIPFYAA